MKVLRKVIRIDEEKCDGCRLCIPSCPEGALQIVETPKGPKARLVKENFCDGLGACLGECPQGALSIEQREVENYDEEGVIAHIKENSPELLEKHLAHLREHADELPEHHSHRGIPVCPSAQMQSWKSSSVKVAQRAEVFSQLRQWPIQLHLVPPSAPYFKKAELILVADCVPFAYADFHQDFLKDKAVAIGCPKLDEVETYIEKIAQIIKLSKPKSIKVVYMEVPCCFGLVRIVQEAMAISGEKIPTDAVMISIKGEKMQEKALASQSQVL